MSAAEKLSLLFEELLALEAETGEKYEFHDGFPVSMAGGTPAHAHVSANTITALSNALRGKGCTAYSSDARVAIEATNSYVYPDATVVCGPLETGKGNSIANPTLVVEVMSESTELYDRGEKAQAYRRIPSLRQYLLVSQKKAYIESYHKTADGFWQLSEAEGLEQSIRLHGLSLEIRLSDVYRDVVFGTEKIEPKPETEK